MVIPGLGVISSLSACLPLFLLIQRPFKAMIRDGGSGRWAGAPGLLATSLMLLLLAFAAPYRWGLEGTSLGTRRWSGTRAPSRFLLAQFVIPLVPTPGRSLAWPCRTAALGIDGLRGALVLGLALMAYEATTHRFIGDRSVDEPNVFLL